MNHSVAMSVVQRARHCDTDAHRVVHWKLSLALEATPERLAFYVRHGVVEKAACLAGVEQRQEMRMLQVGHHTDLGEKTLWPQDRPEFGKERLERDSAIMPEIPRQVYGGHAAAAKFALDLVPAAQRRT